MKTFHGGVHPNSNKSATASKQVVVLAPPEELIFPVSQHIGAPAVPFVKAGDSVLMGQKIAEANGAVSANIHSSVSGTVKGIEKRLHPNGTYTDCIIIENDGLDTPTEKMLSNPRDYKNMSKEEILDEIREAGIVGMGGATFPTHIKLTPPPEAKIDYVIINGAECEPYLTSDHRVMLEAPETVITGLAIVLKLFDLKEGYIGIEDNKPDAIAHMKKTAEKYSDVKINIVPLRTKYPQGSEKQLINAVTKRKLKPGQLPWQVGCIVMNIDTVASVRRIIEKNRPLIQRIVTVSGDAVNAPGNFLVRIGTPFSYVLEQSGGFSQEPKKVLMGGPMMGLAVPNTNVPVIKGTSGILALGEKSAKLEEENSCIRCGKCVFACPMSLQPNLLDMYSRNDDFENLNKLNISDCIECGSCAYVCPSKRRQVQQIKVAKVKLRNKAK